MAIVILLGLILAGVFLVLMGALVIAVLVMKLTADFVGDRLSEPSPYRMKRPETPLK